MAVSYLGNESLMQLPKVSFLSSRSITPDAVMNSHAWAAKIRETDTCVISGFHSDLEKDVLKFLLRGKCPVVIVEARTPRKRVPAELRAAFNAGRILFVALLEEKRRISETAATKRNRFVLENSVTHVFGAVSRDGNLSSITEQLDKKTIQILSK